MDHGGMLPGWREPNHGQFNDPVASRVEAGRLNAEHRQWPAGTKVSEHDTHSSAVIAAGNTQTANN
jgi:hypothetical protein